MPAPDFINQILNGGMLSYGSPNPLDRGLMSGDPSMQLGMQMLANSGTPGRFGSILGRSMLGMQDAQQKNALSQLDLLTKGIGAEQNVQTWPYLQQAMAQAFGQPGQPPLGGQPPDPSQIPGAPTAGPPAVSQQGAPQGQQPGLGPIGGVGSPDALANLGGISAFMGRPGGQQLIDLAKFRTENDPSLITQKALAGSPIAQDLDLLRRAQASGDPVLAKGAYVKALKDLQLFDVGTMNGNLSLFGGLTPDQVGYSSISPQHGTMYANGVQAPIPHAPETAATMAGAEAQGRATGETIPVTLPDGSQGFVPKSVITGSGGAPSAKAPTPNNAQGFTPKSSVPGAPSVAPTAGRAPVKTGDPQLDKALADPDYKLPPPKPGFSAPKAVIESRQKLLEDSGTATEAASMALQYTKAAQQIMDGKGAPVVGLYGPIVAEISRVWGGVDSTNYQKVAKYLGNAALQNVKQTYGNRMTQNEVKLQLNELSPSTHMNDETIKDLLATNARSSQYTIDSAKRASAYLKAGNDPQLFRQWDQQHFPRQDVVNNPASAKNTSSGTAPAAALAYLQAHPETASHFRAKYGYLPNGQ